MICSGNIGEIKTESKADKKKRIAGQRFVGKILFFDVNEERDRKMKRSDMRVYAITDRHWLHGETLYSQVEKALEGGVAFIQLREKNLDEESFLKEAVEIQALCKKYRVPFVINDNVDIALKIDADGVHVGQDDMEAGDVRVKLGKDKIIGVSAHSVSEALAAQEKGADYLGVGAVFPTSSKENVSALPLETLKAICDAVTIPVVAIGGISADNIDRLYGSGIDGVAVISAIFGQKDIQKATEELVRKAENL